MTFVFSWYYTFVSDFFTAQESLDTNNMISCSVFWPLKYCIVKTDTLV